VLGFTHPSLAWRSLFAKGRVPIPEGSWLTETKNGTIEPKDYAFRRWLNIPIII